MGARRGNPPVQQQDAPGAVRVCAIQIGSVVCCSGFFHLARQAGEGPQFGGLGVTVGQNGQTVDHRFQGVDEAMLVAYPRGDTDRDHFQGGFRRTFTQTIGPGGEVHQQTDGEVTDALRFVVGQGGIPGGHIRCQHLEKLAQGVHD